MELQLRKCLPSLQRTGRETCEIDEGLQWIASVFPGSWKKPRSSVASGSPSFFEAFQISMFQRAARFLSRSPAISDKL